MICPRRLRLLATLLLFPLFLGVLTWMLSKIIAGGSVDSLEVSALPPETVSHQQRINSAFIEAWEAEEIILTPEADVLTLIRRLSLALTGAPPSVEELRRLDTLPAGADPVQAWLDHLFDDPRYHAYFAERLARAFVGVEQGPFLVYRRRRLVNWLSDQLAENRPYDAMVRDLISSEGVWTSNPAANFVTAAVIQDGENEGPDEIKLAARTSRAFLGISLDCMQCHDDKFGDHWKQEHFHELAAFYAQTEMSLTGIREKRSQEYEVAFLGEAEPREVEASVPFHEDLLPDSGNRRARLAQWMTHDQNRPFARAAVNRIWALLFGRPLHDPVDEIPLHGPFPSGMEALTDAFIEEGHSLRTLIRMIAASSPFQRDSRSADLHHPVTQIQENLFAAFPITPLRSEQVAGSVIQASSLHALDGEVHILTKFRRWGETQEFVKRYGDQGEDEFTEEAGTIPQRLLLMNGELVSERTKPNPIMNSASRIAHYSPSNEEAINTAFLATLTRHPNNAEREHFLAQLSGASRKQKPVIMADLFWALINSTEFSWNR